jgi:lysophospholipid acyltransferase (LPLAT)-like uncharacterized protein
MNAISTLFKTLKTHRWTFPLWWLPSWPVAAYLYVRSALVRWTSRMSVEGPGADYPGAAVYVNWHSHLPWLCVQHGQRQRWLMVSPAPYMMPIARWCEWCGLRLVEGASGQQGREAAAQLDACLRRGESVFIAVDGPAGPIFKVKRGCIDIARAAGVPVIPVGYSIRRGKPNRKRWDLQLMPALCDEIHVRFGAPLFIDPSEDIGSAAERVEIALNQLCGVARLEAAVGERT